MSTLRRVPWLPGTALVICDVLEHDSHTEVAHSPRAVLKKQLDRLSADGLYPLAAAELEFFLFYDSYEEAFKKAYRGLSPSSTYNEDYHIFQTTKEEEVMRAIRNGLHGAGVPVENSKGEADAGQGEINIRYAPMLDAADRHVIVKNGCKEIAWAHGRALTFMAKWNDNAAGNSCHIHQSLSNAAGEPLFYDAAAEGGMSAMMKNFLAGQLHHAAAITYFLAPYINSYKRFVAGTFAPTALVWSRDNRTAGFRVCAEKTPAVRVECRIGGGDLNAYLAMAALLAAGHDGIRQNMPLEEAYVGSAYEAANRIPSTLREAATALDNSSMLRAVFGDAVIDHYLRAAEWEQIESDRRVTDFDIYRCFERA